MLRIAEFRRHENFVSTGNFPVIWIDARREQRHLDGAALALQANRESLPAGTDTSAVDQALDNVAQRRRALAKLLELRQERAHQRRRARRCIQAVTVVTGVRSARRAGRAGRGRRSRRPQRSRRALAPPGSSSSGDGEPPPLSSQRHGGAHASS